MLTRLNIKCRFSEGAGSRTGPNAFVGEPMTSAVMATYDRFDIAFERGEGAYGHGVGPRLQCNDGGCRRRESGGERHVDRRLAADRDLIAAARAVDPRFAAGRPGQGDGAREHAFHSPTSALGGGWLGSSASTTSETGFFPASFGGGSHS